MTKKKGPLPEGELKCWEKVCGAWLVCTLRDGCGAAHRGLQGPFTHSTHLLKEPFSCRHGELLVFTKNCSEQALLGLLLGNPRG